MSLFLFCAVVIVSWTLFFTRPVVVSNVVHRSLLPIFVFDCMNIWFSHNLELVTDATDAADATEVVSSTAARTPLPRAPGAREHEWGKPEVQTETIWQMHGIPRIPA